MIKIIVAAFFGLLSLTPALTHAQSAAPAATKPFTANLVYDTEGGATLTWTEMPGAFEYCISSLKTSKLHCVFPNVFALNIGDFFTIDKTDNYSVEARNEDGTIAGGRAKGLITATVAADPAKKDVVQAQTEFGAVANLGEYATSIMKYALPLGIALSIIMTIYAGIMYMLSQGQPDKVKEAQEIIQGAVLGLIVLIMSRLLVNFLILPTPESTSTSTDQTEESSQTAADSAVKAP